jgi:hypothetical protein
MYINFILVLFRVAEGFDKLSDAIKTKLQNAKDFIKLTVEELKEIPQDVFGSLQVINRLCFRALHIRFIVQQEITNVLNLMYFYLYFRKVWSICHQVNLLVFLVDLSTSRSKIFITSFLEFQPKHLRIPWLI